MDADISDLLDSPWEREGALLDEVRKDGANETVEKAVVAAVRLLKGIESDLSPETIAKLGTELYGRGNPKLNTTSVKAPGELEGDGDGDELHGSGSGADKDGSGSGSSLEGDGSAPKVAADSDGDDQEPDGDADDKKKKRRLFGKKDVSKEDSSVEDDLSTIDERGTVEVQVPVKKEDGTWDLSGVPEESRPFFMEMIQKADKTADELTATREQLQKADDELLHRSMVEKAARYSHVAAVDDLTPVLKEASQKLDSETFGKLQELLGAAEERIQKGDLFSEQGRSSLGESKKDDAYSLLVEKADELVEKGDGITKEQAFDRAMRDNPALYDRYMAERMGV